MLEPDKGTVSSVLDELAGYVSNDGIVLVYSFPCNKLFQATNQLTSPGKDVL